MKWKRIKIWNKIGWVSKNEVRKNQNLEKIGWVSENEVEKKSKFGKKLGGMSN